MADEDLYPDLEQVDAYDAPYPGVEEDLPDYGGWPYPHVEPVRGALDRVALALYGNLPNIPTQRYEGQPSGAGAAFLTGLAGGFSKSRVRGISEREALNKALAQKAHDENVAAARATAAATAEKGREKAGERAFGRAKELEIFKRGLPAAPETDVVTEADTKAMPWLKPALGWKRTTAVAAFQPETEKDKRSAAREQRALAADERKDRIAAASNLNQLRDDYRNDKQIMAYANVRSNLKTGDIAAKQQNGTGDVALIFSYMRALEPDNPNVVREGDFKVARLAAGALQAAESLPARFFKGDLLTESGRQHFLTQMRSSLKARRSDFDLANQQYRDTAKDFGVNPDRFIRDFSDAAENPPATPPANTVRMRTPDGRMWALPPDKVADARARGAVEVR